VLFCFLIAMYWC